MKAPDGEDLGAYILGVFEPLESFSGNCLAVIHRLDDDDDKLVVVGGVIPDEDAESLMAAGVDQVFTMGARTADIATYIREWWGQRER